MHPRQDLSRHHLIPMLLEAGVAVWAQGSRSVNNDLTLIHEQTVLDAAAGFAHLRGPWFRAHGRLRTIGRRNALRILRPAGQPGRPGDRIRVTPGVGPSPWPTPTSRCPMRWSSSHRTPVRATCCWAASTVPSPMRPIRCRRCPLDFSTRQRLSRADQQLRIRPAEFLAAYREAQRARVARIDAHARYLIAERMAAKKRFASEKRIA